MKNTSNHNTELFYSKYGYKTQHVSPRVMLYSGRIDECPKKLIEGVKIDLGHKFIKIWE